MNAFRRRVVFGRLLFDAWRAGVLDVRGAVRLFRAMDFSAEELS